MGESFPLITAGGVIGVAGVRNLESSVYFESKYIFGCFSLGGRPRKPDPLPQLPRLPHCS